MKTKIESDGKVHVCRLIAENVFEQAAIDAICVFSSKAELSKDDSAGKVRDANDKTPKYDTLVIRMTDSR
jgi:hypothetical protein